MDSLKLTEEKNKKDKWVEESFYTKDANSLENFRKKIENEWGKKGIKDKEHEGESIVNCADKVLKKTIKKKLGRTT